MNKGVSWGFLAVSATFFLFIVGLTGYRIENARQLNVALVQGRFAGLLDRVSRAHQEDGAWDSPQLRSDLRAIFDSEPRLLLLSVHSPADGILYLVTRNRWYLKEPAVITPDWRGTPEYQLSKGYETLLSGSLPDGQRSSVADAVYVIMGREDLYPIVRDDLYLFLAFLLVCGVFALIVTGTEQVEHPASVPGRPPAPSGRYSAAPTVSSPPMAQPRDSPAAPEPASRIVSESPESPRSSPRSAVVLSASGSTMDRLHAELQRAEAADEDLTLARISVDPSSEGPGVHDELGAALREQFTLVDLVFAEPDRSYTVVLPDMELDDALRSLDDLRKKMAASSTAGRPRSVSAGASARSGRLIDAGELREEAEVALSKASREGGNQVIGFRADAARFRGLLRGTEL